jgi:cellulose synthase/poly-beta-1,6-N-acetylglucosamine synthase-like glycosyltransferase
VQFTQVELTPIVIFNGIMLLFFTLAFFYQIIYLLVGAKRGEVKLPEAKKNHRYAFMIAAHNEEVVIGELVESIKQQDYPSDLVDIYVVADACTDDTARVAREAGATVFERNDLVRKGKSWALDMGFDKVLTDKGDDYYDAFIIFDADNLLSKTYLYEMNKLVDMGYLAGTSYRNSKNFDSSWVSSAYAIWFLREARFLNNARMILGTSCAISGSGWMVSSKIIRGMRGWDFHTLTEDIQFSTFCAANGVKIGYAPAEFYDEQPVTFAASWTQRMRWTKGFYEVFFSYCGDLMRGIGKGRFDSYDLLMTVAPGMILTLLSALVNTTYLLVGYLSHGFLATDAELSMAVGSLLMTFLSIYTTFFALALITTIFERRHIHAAKKWRIVTNIFTFPLFMMTYIPITVAALFKKVEWVPTKHEFAMTVDEVVNNEA